MCFKLIVLNVSTESFIRSLFLYNLWEMGGGWLQRVSGLLSRFNSCVEMHLVFVRMQK